MLVFPDSLIANSKVQINGLKYCNYKLFLFAVFHFYGDRGTT